MTGLWIAVAVLFALFLGVLLCVVAFAFWYLLKILTRFRESVDSLSRVTGEVMQEGSLARMAKSLFVISRFIETGIPEMMDGFKEFSRVMKIFNKNAFDQEKVAAAEPEAGSVYTATEAEQAQHELVEEAKRHKINISDEQLAAMRTEGRR
jgi:hypothetical protein